MARLNLIALNIGYHNEHHDFPDVPWSRLPQLKQMAPEYYDGAENPQILGGIVGQIHLRPAIHIVHTGRPRRWALTLLPPLFILPHSPLHPPFLPYPLDLATGLSRCHRHKRRIEAAAA